MPLASGMVISWFSAKKVVTCPTASPVCAASSFRRLKPSPTACSAVCNSSAFCGGFKALVILVTKSVTLCMPPLIAWYDVTTLPATDDRPSEKLPIQPMICSWLFSNASAIDSKVGIMALNAATLKPSNIWPIWPSVPLIFAAFFRSISDIIMPASRALLPIRSNSAPLFASSGCNSVASLAMASK